MQYIIRRLSAYFRGRCLNSDPWFFLIGILMSMGLFLPFFGRSFTFFGIHVRIVSFALLCFIYLLAWPGFSLREAKNDIGAAFMILLLIIILHSSRQQMAQIFIPQFNQSFVEGKLATILQLSCPAILAAYLASPLRNRTSFQNGFWWGAVGLGVLGVACLVMLKPEYFSRPGGFNVTGYQIFHELSVFSPISMSLVLMTGLIAALGPPTSQNRLRLISAATGLAMFWGVITLGQRGHTLFVLLLVMIFVFHFLGRKVIKSLLVFLPVAAVVFLAIMLGVFGDTVSGMWMNFIQGNSFTSRFAVWGPALNEFVAAPLGSGLGAFGLRGDVFAYPHNFIIEAFYELGIPGGLVMVAVYVLPYRNIIHALKPEFSSTRNGKSWFISTSAFLFMLHSMKSGSFAYMYPVVAMLLIAPGESLIWGGKSGN